MLLRIVFGKALLLVLCASLSLAVADGEQPSTADKKDKAEEKEAPVHAKLRELRAGVVKAVNAQKIDDLMEYLHPNIVAVWQDGTISRGHKGVKEYYEKHLGGPDSTLVSYTIDEPKIPELSIPYGDNTAISWGTMTSHFKFRSGRTFDLNGPWSVTMVNDKGKWQIASVHASAPLFDNPLLTAASNTLYWGCGVAGVIGLFAGVLLMAAFGRRKPA